MDEDAKKISGLLRVGVSRDNRQSDGSPMFPLSVLEESGIHWEFLDEDVVELRPEDVDGYGAIIFYEPRVTAATLACEEPPLLLARLGVGYDRVDVEACTKRGVLVAIAPDGARSSMASAGMAFVLALAHELVEKDRRARRGNWAPFAVTGKGVTGRTIGVIGLGNIGRRLCVLANAFDMNVLGCDPYASGDIPGAEMRDLESLLESSDFICLTCPLTPETFHLINADRLRHVRPDAYIVNIARGPLVDEVALRDAITEGRLRGAALDVFEREPIDAENPLCAMENVVLAPHAIGVTDELIVETGRSACGAVQSLMAGQAPAFLVNPEALKHPRVRARLT